jgi:hypothetical protein
MSRNHAWVIWTCSSATNLKHVCGVSPRSDGGVQVPNQLGQRRGDGVVATCLLSA